MDIEGAYGGGIFLVGVLDGEQGGHEEGSNGDDEVADEEDDGVISGTLLKMLKNAEITGLNDLLLSIRQIQVMENGFESA